MRVALVACAVRLPHDTVPVSLYGAFPLLQFDDQQLVAAIRVLASYQEVDALRGLRNLVFDADSAVIRNRSVIHDLADRDERVPPRPEFT